MNHIGQSRPGSGRIASSGPHQQSKWRKQSLSSIRRRRANGRFGEAATRSLRAHPIVGLTSPEYWTLLTVCLPVDDGVTLDLGLMNQIKYTPGGQIAKIGAGARWGEVYTTLEPYGVTAPGARASKVGVAGFLLSGGNCFFSSMVGFGCDNVVNFEVVLASGEVVNANQEINADLHKALKGGSCNFGVVTRFDVEVFKTGNLWGGQVVYPLSTTEQLTATYVDWVDNIPSYPQGSAVNFWAYFPAAGDIVVAVALHDTTGTARAPAYDRFLSITPQISDTLRVDSHLNMTIELDEPEGYRQIWVTITVKNDARFVRKALEAQRDFIDGWKADQDPDFVNFVTIQAMPKLLFEQSVKRGGNITGMERETDNAVLYQMQHMVRTADQEAEARKRLMPMRQALKQYSRDLGIDVEWQYLGYSDGGHDPLSTCGPENIQLMQDVAAKYDPDGVFQRRVTGGFKLPNSV